MQYRSRIFIVDDHPVFRKGLGELIREESDLTVCGEAQSAAEALGGLANQGADIVIVDITLKDISGMELIHRLREKFPNLPILVISMHDESLYAERALRAGALGYINKQEMTENIIAAIRKVLQGKIYASETMVETLLGKLVARPTDRQTSLMSLLSDRELEVFQLIGQGCSRSQIAEALHVSVKTVGAYKENLKRKLSLRNSTELVKVAIEWSAALP